MLFNALLGLAALAGLLFKSGLQSVSDSKVEFDVVPNLSVVPEVQRDPRRAGASLAPRNGAEDEQDTKPRLRQLAACGMAVAGYIGTALGVSNVEVCGLAAAAGLFVEQGVPLLQQLVVKAMQELSAPGPRSMDAKTDSLAVSASPANFAKSASSAISARSASLASHAAPLLKGSVQSLRSGIENLPAPNLETVLFTWEVASYFRHLFKSKHHEPVTEKPITATFPESVLSLSMPAAMTCSAIIMVASFGLGVGMGVSVVLAGRGRREPIPVHSLSSLQYFPPKERQVSGGGSEAQASTSASSVAPSLKSSKLLNPAGAAAAW